MFVILFCHYSNAGVSQRRCCHLTVCRCSALETEQHNCGFYAIIKIYKYEYNLCKFLQRFFLFIYFYFCLGSPWLSFRQLFFNSLDNITQTWPSDRPTDRSIGFLQKYVFIIGTSCCTAVYVYKHVCLLVSYYCWCCLNISANCFSTSCCWCCCCSASLNVC